MRKVCGEGRDPKFVAKYDRFESSVGTAYDVPLSGTTFIPDSYCSFVK